jgi:hypothetical protein
MSADERSATDGELQFDRAVAGGEGATAEDAAGVVCVGCGTTIRTAYFAAGDATICGACKVKLEMGDEAGRQWSTFARAVLFGLGAAIAGAALYYAVIALTGFEIGLVAIATGFMVGYAIRKATGDHGSRRYQILAAALTYFSVGLAYMPIAIKGALDGKASAAASADSVAVERASGASGVAEADSSAPTGSEGGAGDVSFLKVLGLFLFFVVALPVMAVLGSLPSGLISALIIGFGMQKAWRMTGDARPPITGPHRVGAGSPSPAV